MRQSLADVPSANEGTPVVPLPGPRERIPRATQYRSTWIVASLDGLRHAGYFDAYAAALSGAHRERLLTCVAGAWLPLNVARAHYETCERLQIPDPQYLDMVTAAAQVRQAWHAPLIAGAESDAATPWSVLASLPRGWGRTADGGAIGIFQLAPNHARIECVGCELFDLAYYRRAAKVNFQMLLGRTCKRLVIQELAPRDEAACSYSAQWAQPAAR
jgi:hypothetical protein